MSGTTSLTTLHRARAILFTALFVTALIGPVSAINPPSACSQEGKAAVVVKQSDEEEKSECVDIASGQNSGIDVLQRTNFEVVTKDFGGDLGHAVCKIGSTGSDDCDFAKGFWNYFQVMDGKWAASQKGASSTTVAPEGVEGWVWVVGGGDPNAAPVPPDTEPVFDEICKAAATTPPRSEQTTDGSSPLPWILGGAALVVVVVAIVILRTRSSP
jgi:hypothetical protein